MCTPSYPSLRNASISEAWASGRCSGLGPAVDRIVSFWAEDIQGGLFALPPCYKMYHSFPLWPRRVQLMSWTPR